LASKSNIDTKKMTRTPSSDVPQTRADEPGSFVVGEDGVRRPNLEDLAMRERDRLKTKAASPPESAAPIKEESDES